jgi:hypothetical protein
MILNLHKGEMEKIQLKENGQKMKTLNLLFLLTITKTFLHLSTSESTYLFYKGFAKYLKLFQNI